MLQEALQGLAFQSTLPARGATRAKNALEPRPERFQSTLPARGATTVQPRHIRRGDDFNPRSPRGERRYYTR